MYTYHFSIPRVLCGKFIGVRGCVIKELKAATNCNLIVNNRPHQNSNSRIDKNSDHNESQVSFFLFVFNITIHVVNLKKFIMF